MHIEYSIVLIDSASGTRAYNVLLECILIVMMVLSRTTHHSDIADYNIIAATEPTGFQHVNYN